MSSITIAVFVVTIIIIAFTVVIIVILMVTVEAMLTGRLFRAGLWVKREEKWEIRQEIAEH
jgi:hypothetical protein